MFGCISAIFQKDELLGWTVETLQEFCSIIWILKRWMFLTLFEVIWNPLGQEALEDHAAVCDAQESESGRSGVCMLTAFQLKQTFRQQAPKFMNLQQSVSYLSHWKKTHPLKVPLLWDGKGKGKI